MNIALDDNFGVAWVRCLGVLVLSLLICFGGYGGEIGAITLEISETMANVGDTAEIAVSLVSTTDSPVTLTILVGYDPLKVAPSTEFFEFAVRDFSTGLPIEDVDGNVITRTSAVRLESRLEDLGKVVETEIEEGGFVNLVLSGLNDIEISDGLLFTVAFEVLAGSAENETAVLDGVASDMPVFLGGREFASAGATMMAERIIVNIIDGGIMVGCTAAETPVGLAVGGTNAETVELSWDAVLDPNAEYRVFRNDVPLLDSALPIGEGWQTATFFSDITAPVAEVLGPAGCLGFPLVTVVPQFYWVKSRTSETGCESGFGDSPVEGFRSAKKIVVGSVSASAFPPSGGGADVLLMGLVVLLFVVFGGRRSPFVQKVRW